MRTYIILAITLLIISCEDSSNFTDVTVEQSPSVVDSSFSLSLSNKSFDVVEGESITFDIKIENNTDQISFFLDGDIDNIDWNFFDGDTITINVNFDVAPIQKQTRNLRIVGTSINFQDDVLFDLNIEPTSLPDVYLLAGQSNMVGFSEDGARQIFAGGLDEINPRIRQLNVTNNESFNSLNSFQDENSIAIAGNRLALAIDPLHRSLDSNSNSKVGTRIGFGLSFAKRAIQNTQADIYLVPTGWSDTGFCRRPREQFEGLLGWNATSNNDPAFSGSLLYDRAVARTNLTLSETGGILRGILWHQGEADSTSIICAQQYEQNLTLLAKSLRENVQIDARGNTARGIDSDIPFIVGTMSMGGSFSNFNEAMTIVDGVHRNISQIIPHSAFVNNDSLVPPNYPCGEGSCIHFGSTAYRQMGGVYYDQLLNIVNDR